MSDVIEKMMQTIGFVEKPVYEDYVNTDKITRIKTLEII
jgi:hypothetical protein